MTGGRGKKRLEMSQLNMSQLGFRGGRVKLIETMSQNLHFFFWKASLNQCYLWKISSVFQVQCEMDHRTPAPADRAVAGALCRCPYTLTWAGVATAPATEEERG